MLPARRGQVQLRIVDPAGAYLHAFAGLPGLGLDLGFHVPFPSGAPFVTALMSGTIEWGLLAAGYGHARQNAPARSIDHTGSTRAARPTPKSPIFAKPAVPADLWTGVCAGRANRHAASRHRQAFGGRSGGALLAGVRETAQGIHSEARYANHEAISRA